MSPSDLQFCDLCGDNVVTLNDYCVGCRRFVCRDHATIFGDHEADEHNAEEEK